MKAKAVLMLLFALAMFGFSAPHIASAQDQDSLLAPEDPTGATADSAAAYRETLMAALNDIDAEIASLQAPDAPALSSVTVVSTDDVVEEADQAVLDQTIEANSAGIQRLRDVLTTSEAAEPAGVLKGALESSGITVEEVIALAVQEDGGVVIFTAPTS